MWFSKPFLLLSLTLFLTACGFRPLYNSNVDGINICYPIKIATIKDRQGQILRNYLVDLLTPQGTPPKPQYILEVDLTTGVRSVGINKDETTSRKEAVLTAQFKLKDTKTNAVVLTHTAISINSFNVLGKVYYADLVAENYAIKEAARLLAEKIVLILSSHLDMKT